MPTFFAAPEKFGAWLAKNHAKRKELVVGFWKVGSGNPSMIWAQSVEQALVYGWIDGVRRSIDGKSYTIRFTPRRRGSHWSAINVATAKRLIAGGRMAPAGRAAFDARDVARTAQTSYEQRKGWKLPPGMAKRLKADVKASADFAARPPSYQRAVKWWIASAKQEETRERRFLRLLALSRAGKVLPPFKPRRGKK